MTRHAVFSHVLLDEKDSTGAGDGHQITTVGNANTTFQATLDDVSTTPAATVDIEVSNDKKKWIVMGTISVSGNGDTDGFAANASWKFVRANVTAISDGGGTAKVTVTAGE